MKRFKRSQFVCALFVQLLENIGESSETMFLKHIFDWEKFFTDIGLTKKGKWKPYSHMKAFVIKKSSENKIRIKGRDFMIKTHHAGKIHSTQNLLSFGYLQTNGNQFLRQRFLILRHYVIVFRIPKCLLYGNNIIQSQDFQKIFRKLSYF